MTETRPYRTTFILNTRQWTDSNEALLAKVQEQLESLGATIEKTDKLGQKTFSRITETSNPDGLYIQLTLQAPPATAQQIHSSFNLDKTIKRILIEAL